MAILWVKFNPPPRKGIYIKTINYPLVICGVVASGKTTIAQRIASELELPFVDADDLHSAANRKKMSEGVALQDEDRASWLDEVSKAMDRPVVLSCSALKRKYRQQLRNRHADAVFLFLNVSKSELQKRLANRTGHFMSPSLLDSQLAIAEPIGIDEPGINLDGERSIEDILKSAHEYISR